MLNFAEQTGSGAVMFVWSYLKKGREILAIKIAFAFTHLVEGTKKYLHKNKEERMGRLSRYRKVKSGADAPRGRNRSGRKSKKTNCEFDSAPDDAADDFYIDGEGNIVMRVAADAAAAAKKKKKKKKNNNNNNNNSSSSSSSEGLAKKREAVTGTGGGDNVSNGNNNNNNNDNINKSNNSESESESGCDAFDEAANSYGAEKLSTLSDAVLKSSLVPSSSQGRKGSRGGARMAGSDNNVDGLTVGSSSSSSSKLFEAKQEGESMRAFNRRIREETRKVLVKDMAKPVMNPRKKDYLSGKKRRRSRKGGGKGGDGGVYEYDGGNGIGGDGDDGGDGDRRTFGVDKVRFGEQAERPPQFDVVPKLRKKNQHVLYQQQEQATQKNRRAGGEIAGAGQKAKDRNAHTTQREGKEKNEEIEKMRNDVIRQYKLLKAKKRSIAGGGSGIL